MVRWKLLGHRDKWTRRLWNRSHHEQPNIDLETAVLDRRLSDLRVRLFHVLFAT